MPTHKSEDCKISTIKHYLDTNKIDKNKKHLLYIISFKENTFIYYSNDYKTIY